MSGVRLEVGSSGVVGVEGLDEMMRRRRGVWQHALLGRNDVDVSYSGVLFISSYLSHSLPVRTIYTLILLSNLFKEERDFSR